MKEVIIIRIGSPGFAYKGLEFSSISKARNYWKVHGKDINNDHKGENISFERIKSWQL